MTPFFICMGVAAVALLLWFLGRQFGNATVQDAGFAVGMLNAPLLAFLLRGVFVLALAFGSGVGMG